MVRRRRRSGFRWVADWPYLVYVYESGNLTVDEIVATFRNASQPLTQRIMTTADQLRQEGRQEGKLEAELRAVRAFLGMNRTVETIAAALELTEGEVRQRIDLLRDQNGGQAW